jgi:hypothetical protein
MLNGGSLKTLCDQNEIFVLGVIFYDECNGDNKKSKKSSRKEILTLTSSKN